MKISKYKFMEGFRIDEFQLYLLKLHRLLNFDDFYVSYNTDNENSIIFKINALKAMRERIRQEYGPELNCPEPKLIEQQLYLFGGAE